MSNSFIYSSIILFNKFVLNTIFVQDTVLSAKNNLSLHVCVSRSVVSDSLWPHRRQLSRLLCPGNSPGSNTAVGCHSLLQGIFPTQGSNTLSQKTKAKPGFQIAEHCWQFWTRTLVMQTNQDSTRSQQPTYLLSFSLLLTPRAGCNQNPVSLVHHLRVGS